MVDGNFIIPLSPPSSPHMSAYSTSAADHEWHSSDVRTLEHTPPHSDNDMAMLQAEVSGHNFDMKRPSMRSHKSFPYLLDGKSHLNSGSTTPSGHDEIEHHDVPNTRFLMSEFARQAHPDAAHRERLAREIPGLSPRQVQVWFQNRRAKLKRLTSDDRERMMRSRALPDDFDMASALHSPFGNSHGLGTPLASPASYNPSFPESNMMRPLSIDTFRRGPLDSHMSPTGISPAFGGFAFTPPQSATDTISPVSAHEGSPFGFHSAPIDTSPRTSNPFTSMPVSSPPAYAAQHSIPRLSLHADRVVRSRAESLQSPLRTSMSYTSDSSNSGDSHGHHDSSRGYSSSMMPYGIGYSYSPVPGFGSNGNRLRSFSNGVPRRIELSTHYTPHRNGSTPQTAQFPSYSGSPLVTPQSYAMPQMSAPHHMSSFPNSYMRNDSAHHDSYSAVGSILGEVMENTSQHSDDHHDQY
ncbi:Homeodomain-containing transcription factor [Pyrenophora tritici-repentis]|nr:Homeodomain-containing transcription factor [Pyrenophora tritici-repentis]KAG9379632.1 Homeodomain-containing transcription factor [Pyrenophora tritici-repentis]KAI1549151.1 Homeodomain-containing transcription factor [Pyrenophora tritici-repentis]KAI1553115.1 Homeodomain-containing transcription factor [Pyrenophora tritici-repentis]KAI1558220.1 Homeodomain-containing transcription factor [Pyrenophora tritici-repentis]